MRSIHSVEITRQYEMSHKNSNELSTKDHVNRIAIR